VDAASLGAAEGAVEEAVVPPDEQEAIDNNIIDAIVRLKSFFISYPPNS